MIDDKFQQHYRQQMSALMDGELAPDQARFLMRRMAEDSVLNDTWERWQLCGDVLRGRAQAPAPQGFAERVSTAIAAQATAPAANQEFHRGAGNRLLRWGGGAIAASVALVALFMAGQQGKPTLPAPRPAALASSTAPAPAATPAPAPAAPAPLSSTDAGTALAGSTVVVASLPRRADDGRRGSATRNQQAARATAAITRQALAAVNAPPPRAAAIDVQSPVASQDPFAGAQLGQAAARPWPRANLPQLHAGGAYSAGYAAGDQAPYYPFQPRLPDPAPGGTQDPPPSQP
jgi:negative regulator of sigma E activity